MTWLRRVLNHFGLARPVAKTPDPLIERADKVINDVDTLRVEVVTKADLKALRRLQTVARKR